MNSDDEATEAILQEIDASIEQEEGQLAAQRQPSIRIDYSIP